MMLLILIKRTQLLDAPMNDPAPDPLFYKLPQHWGHYDY